MELNKDVNEKYLKDKKAFENSEKLQKIFEETKKDLKTIERQIEDAKIAIIRAQEDKDRTTQKAKEAELKTLEEKKKGIVDKANKQKGILEKQSAKVEAYMQEIEKDPELKAHINSIMEKQYNRKLNKIQKEKSQLDTLRDTISKHSTLENNIRGMIKAKSEVEGLNEELKNLDIVKDKARIDEINNVEIPSIASKRELNRKNLKEYLEKNNIDVSMEFIDDLVKNNKFSRDGKGNINVNKTLNKMSKGYDKRITAYTKAIEKIPNAKVYSNEKEEAKKEEKVGEKQSRVDEKETGNEGVKQEESLVPVEKGFHPIKKLKAWLDRKKVERQEKKESKEEKDEDEDKEIKVKESNKFKDAYKYDMIQDYINKKETELLKEAYKESKKVTSTDKDKEEEEVR